MLKKIKLSGSILLIVIFFCNFQLLAQDSIQTPFFISLNYRTGKNHPHRDIIANLDYPYRGIDFKLGWQSIGKQTWQQAYRYPSYGIGLNWNTFKTDILGSAVAAYCFTNFPQITTSWGRLDLEVDFGISYGINPYDSISNPDNFSTGSSVNAFFGLYLEQTVYITKNFDAFISGGFTHYSNGALMYPNLGLNIPSLKFGVRYIPHRVEKLPKYKLPNIDNHWQINTYFGFGAKTFRASTPYYKEFLVAPALYYRTSYKRRVGIGFEIAYNEIFQAHWDTRDYTGTQLLTEAVFAAHEFIIEQFTIFTQLGFYLNNKPRETIYYERIGFSYYLAPHTRISLAIKAHYIKAEYVEGGLLFDLNFKKKK